MDACSVESGESSGMFVFPSMCQDLLLRFAIACTRQFSHNSVALNRAHEVQYTHAPTGLGLERSDGGVLGIEDMEYPVHAYQFEQRADWLRQAAQLQVSPFSL